MKPSPLYKNIETGIVLDSTEAATYKGIAIKTLIFLAFNLVGALGMYFVLPQLIGSGDSASSRWLVGALVAVSIASILAVIFGLLGRFIPRLAKVFGSIYSFCIGLVIGTLTTIVDHYLIRFAGLICITGTLIIFGVMLLLFATGVVKPSAKLKAIVLGILIAGLLLTIATLIFGIVLNVRNITGSINGWSISAYLGLCIGVEVFFLLYGVITLTFNFCEAQAVVTSGASKDAEWTVALGMEISLVYIYVELLRILVLIASLVDRR